MKIEADLRGPEISSCAKGLCTDLKCTRKAADIFAGAGFLMMWLRMALVPGPLHCLITTDQQWFSFLSTDMHAVDRVHLSTGGVWWGFQNFSKPAPPGRTQWPLTLFRLKKGAPGAATSSQVYIPTGINKVSWTWILVTHWQSWFGWMFCFTIILGLCDDPVPPFGSQTPETTTFQIYYSGKQMKAWQDEG